VGEEEREQRTPVVTVYFITIVIELISRSEKLSKVNPSFRATIVDARIVQRLK